MHEKCNKRLWYVYFKKHSEIVVVYFEKPSHLYLYLRKFTDQIDTI